MPTTVVTSNSVMSLYGSPDLRFTAEVTAETGTPAGVVQFQVDGEDDGPPVPLDARGRAVFGSTDYLDVEAQVAARYAGTAEFEPSRADFWPLIVWAPTATTARLTPLAATPVPTAVPDVSPSTAAPRRPVAAGGPLTVVVRPTAAARRALAKGRAVRVDVTLRFRPSAGGATQTLTRRVTVKPRR